MIIYGSKVTELAKEHLTDKCPNCGTQNSVDMYVFQRYAHVFWIPFFPLAKTGVSQCSHCKQVLKRKEMPTSLATAYENVKAQTKTPLWTFAGLAVVVVLIIIGILNDRKKHERSAQLILAPRAGDILKVKMKDNQYTLYKVNQVQGDSVFVQVNNYEVNETSGLDDLRKKSYSDDVYGFSKTELKAMLNQKEILELERE